MVLGKFKGLILASTVGFFALFSITNIRAFYSVSDYWIFVLFEIIAITILLIVFIMTLKLDMFLEQEGYINMDIKNRFNIQDEDVHHTINKIMRTRNIEKKIR